MNMDLAGFSLFNANHLDGTLSPRVYWCHAENTRTTADGSLGDPFSTIQAALDAHSTDGITDGQVRQVMIFGGLYEENLTIPGKGIIELCAVGPVDLGTIAVPRGISRNCDPTDQVAGVTPLLRIVCADGANPIPSAFVGGMFNVTGKLLVRDTGAGQTQHVNIAHTNLQDLPAAAVGIDSSVSTAAIPVVAEQCIIAGVGGSAVQLYGSETRFSAAAEFDLIAYAQGCEFQDVTVNSPSSSPSMSALQGLYGCLIDGSWTGLAGSLLCDRTTQTLFLNAPSGGSLLGGATIALVDSPVDDAQVKTHSAFTGSESHKITAAKQTTDGSVNALFTLALADNSTYWIEVWVVARLNPTHRAAYRREVMVYREGGGGATFGGAGVQTPFTDESNAAWDCTINTSGNDIVVEITGEAATVNWVGTMRYQCVSDSP